MFLSPFEPFDNTCAASSSSIWIYDTSFGGSGTGSMSSNKLTNIAPTLSLGPPPHSAPDLSTLTSHTQPPINTLHTPSQPLITSPLGAHTLNLSANPLGLNAGHTMSTLNTPTHGLSSLSSPVQNPSPQPLLSSPQVTSIVSLPQSFCFSSQSAQTSAAGTSQPLGVTLGFPVASAGGLNSNTFSLNTSSIPLNTSSFPLNANTIPLNAGGAIPQHFMQSLSLGQQQTICGSLPQNFSFPLGQALFTMPGANGASGGPFLSTTFPGLQSVIMGSQQSLLQGAVMGPASTAQGAQLHSLGTLAPQSVSFPISTEPVLTELPTTPQPAQLALEAPDKQQCRPPSGQQEPHQPLLTSPHLQQGSQNSANQPHPSLTSTAEKPALTDVGEQTSEPSVQTETAAAQPVQGEGEHAASPPSDLAEKHKLEQASAQPPPLSSSPAVLAQPQPLTQQPVSDTRSKEEEPAVVSSADVEELKAEESGGKKGRKGEEPLEQEVIFKPSDGQGGGELMDTSPADIKQEALETEETSTPPPPKVSPSDDSSSTSPQVTADSSPVKVEASADQVDSMDPHTSTHSASHLYTSQLDRGERATRMHHSLLTSLKQEALEVEEEEDLPLPDSTPGSEDSLDSYSQRHSPSPMASLRLTRADTTTITTTSSYSRSRLEEGEGVQDVKHFPAASGEHLAADVDDAEFVWEDYLQETGAAAVPPTAFKHVECSLQSGFVKGMRVEVPNRCNPGTYWVAAVVMTCGPLLRVRYEGYEDDASHDFWCDLSTCEIHPIGWCAESGLELTPPEGIQEKYKDRMAALKDMMKTAPAAPSYLLDKTTGTSPIDQLQQGMRLELQDRDRPIQVWLARIMENVGGRLYLRVEGMDSGLADFWAFYLDEHLHPIGWAKQRGYTYAPPKVLKKQGLSESEIQQILDTALKEAEEQKLPADIFKDQAPIGEHKFKRGMKLEAVNPNSSNHIGPATVVEVMDRFYFNVEMDDLTLTDPAKRTRFSCHSSTPTIFPIQWTVYKGIKLTAPPGWPKADFNWAEYLNHCRAMAAPDSCFLLDYEDQEFERGMKLECVNPDSPNQICAATITKLVAHLMWVHLDSSARIVASHVEHVASHNLFPVGWCESNGFQLRPPRRAGLPTGTAAHRRVAVVQPEMAEGVQVKEEESKGKTYCPKIYFNHKCFSGPHLSKGRIAELPCSVGPGPLGLVMKEVLSMLISVAYKSSRVLREIQLDGPPNPSMTQHILKAKYKNKSYRAVVEICRTTNQLEDFCRQVCIKLECCPNLISPHFVGDSCPENCSQLTKTKYTYYYGKKKRKIGRPPGGHTNLENGPKKPTKRRKRRRLGMVVRKAPSPNGEEGEEEGEEADDKTSEASDTPTVDSSSSNTITRLHDHKPHSLSASAVISKRLKRKYTHHIPPPSEIRTRGAKLPRYSFERRTHKKILLSPTASGVSGLRSKTLQSHQLHHKSQKLTRSHSPEQLHTQPSSTAITRHNTHPYTHHHHPPRPCTSPLSIGTPSTPFSLPPPCSPLALDKNPLHWTVAETVHFIKTTDCAHVAKLFRDQEIDGQALLLLTLPTVQEHLELKLGPAIKLCHEIERVKRAFYTRYDAPQPSTHY